MPNATVLFGSSGIRLGAAGSLFRAVFTPFMSYELQKQNLLVDRGSIIVEQPHMMMRIRIKRPASPERF